MSKRFISALLIAVVPTFALYVFMAYLIMPSSRGIAVQKTIPVEFTMVKPEEKEQLKKRVPPKQPEPPKQPPPPDTPVEQTRVAMDVPKISLDIPKVTGASMGTGVFLGGARAASTMDGEAIPMIRIQPQYPPKALREGIEGYVRLKFTVMPDGRPSNVVIVESKPRRVFDQAVRRVIYKWKFKPRVVDGKKVAQPNMYYTMEFKLSE